MDAAFCGIHRNPRKTGGVSPGRGHYDYPAHRYPVRLPENPPVRGIIKGANPASEFANLKQRLRELTEKCSVKERCKKRTVFVGRIWTE